MSSNGKLDADELTTVQGSIQLAPDAAADYLAMKATAGAGMAIATPMGGYRTFAQQAALKANPAAYGSTLKPSQIAAAGSSTHGFGECVDVVNGARAWTIAHGAAYGFTQRDPKNDPNCFKHAAGVHSSSFASTGTSVPVPIPVIPQGRQGETMNIAYSTLGDNHYLAQLIGPNGVVDQIDNQAGWAGPPTAYVPNPIYVIYQQLFDPRANVFNPVLTKAQSDLLTARIASNWVKAPAVGGSVDLSGVLAAIAALDTQDDTYQAALIAAIAALPAATRAKIIAAP